MEILEDTMNLPLCGLLLIYFLTMCFDAIFIMMVKVWSNL